MLFLCEAVLGTARRVLSHDDPQWEASEIGYTVIAPMQGYAQLAEMETDGAAFSRLYSLLSVMRVHKMPSTPRVDQRIYMDAGGLKLVAAALTYLPTVQARRFSYRSLTNCEASGQPAGTYKVLPNRKGSGAGTS